MELIELMVVRGAAGKNFRAGATRGATRGLPSLERETVELMELIKLLVVHQVPKMCLHAHKIPPSKRFSVFKKHLKSQSG